MRRSVADTRRREDTGQAFTDAHGKRQMVDVADNEQPLGAGRPMRDLAIAALGVGRCPASGAGRQGQKAAYL